MITMKITIFKVSLITVALVSLLSGNACSKSSPSAAENQKSAGAVALSVIKGSKIKTFSIEQLEELPNLSGYAGQVDDNNKISGPDEYKGVALGDILDTIGGITTSDRVKIIASDNNTRIFSYDQIATGNIDIFDAISGQSTTAPVMVPKLFIAFEINEAPLDAASGPLEFGIMTCQFRVTRDSLWIKKVAKIEVIPAQ
jgi:hypothetical protein